MVSRLAETLSAPVLRLLTGAALAIAAGQFCVVWLSICGVSSDALITLFVSAACGLWIAPEVARRLVGGARVQAMLLSAVLLGMSWTLSGMLDGSLAMGVSLAAKSGLPAGFGFVASGLWFFLCSTILAAWYSKLHSLPSNTLKHSELMTTLGMATGCLTTLFVHSNALVSISVTLTAVVAMSLVMSLQSYPRTETTSGDVADGLLFTHVSLVGLAIFLYTATRINALLVPMSMPLLLVATAISLIGFRILITPMFAAILRNRTVAAGLVLIAVALPAVFGSLININLNWNAGVSSLFLLTLLRSMQLAVFWLIGISIWKLAQVHRSKPGFVAIVSESKAARIASVMMAGFALSTVAAVVGVPTSYQLAGGTIMVLIPLAFATAPSAGCLPVWLSSGTAVVALLFAVMSVLDSARTAQVLFSARSANGIRLGLSADLVSQSHCTRLLETFRSSDGELTVWKTSGNLLELRRDGFPVGQVSTSTISTPQPLAESLTTILPLVMHKNARAVMLLGDDVGVGMRICCNFPIHTIEAIRPDSASTIAANKYTWQNLNTSPLDDERVTIRHEDVATAVRTRRKASGLFDVVIASSPNPMSLSCQEQLTREFYSSVRNQLTSDGVFCQRISQHDLGSEPLLRIMSSLTNLFGRVVVFQMSPGEMAMVAAVNPDSLLDAGLLDRLQRSHVAYELGRSGWDWSQVAALPVIDSNDPLGIFEHEQRLKIVSASSGYFAIGLPLEAARWGNKSAEIQQAFRPHQRRMADAAPRSSVYDEFARRFSAVVQQMEIQTTFHDLPWAYRNSLKIEMQRNPRPAIEEIRSGKITRKADPRDEYRKEYFITLGQALQQASVGVADPVSMKTLTQFTGTYEPLISFFANYELVRIHEATAHPSPARELQHRLHTIYFTDGRDYSIRQITAAIQQIVQDPELLPSDEARFDQANSLLQELVRRWEGRRGYAPPSARRTQRDLDLCIRTANEAMDAMEDWCDAVDMSRSEFLSRRKFINRALIAPLRDYREQVLAHLIKTESNLADSVSEDSDGELPMLIDQSDLMTN